MWLMQMWLRPKAPTTLAKRGSSLWLVNSLKLGPKKGKSEPKKKAVDTVDKKRPKKAKIN